MEEAHKITFNSELKVLSPHNIRGILQQKTDKWITDSRLLKYEGILLDFPKLTLEVTGLQNPAQFLYGEPDEKELAHNCMTTIEEQTKIRPDLEEEELETGERLFVDGSSRVIEGKRVSGYAIIGGPELEVIESGPLNKTWSAQACELYAVLRALERLKDKEGTIYTDSKYAFGVVHTFGKIWEERGLMNSQGKDLIHQELIKRVLIALRKPKKIAVVHLRGHQRGIDFRSRGNNAADQEAKKAALMIIQQKEKGGPRTESLDEEKAEYRFTKTEEQRLSQMGICKDQDGKWKLSDGREVLPKAIALEILHRIHEKTHWGTQAIVDRFGIKYMCIGIHNLAKQIVVGCTTCLQVNKANFRKQPLGGRPLAQRPFANIQVDFTELPKVGRVKYLLVIIDHLTHYVEAFPTTRATTQAVVKVLLENIIPRLQLTEGLHLKDDGWNFVSVDNSEQGTWPRVKGKLIVVGDCKHSPEEIEILPGTLDNNPGKFILWLRCTHPPTFLPKRQIVAQIIPTWERPEENNIPTAHPMHNITEVKPQVGWLKLQEEKVQRMPPWRYLGLEIGKQTIVPQKLEIRTKIQTLADVHQLCGALNWVRLWLGLTTEDLAPLFNLLKGGEELSSPRELTPEAKEVLEKSCQNLSSASPQAEEVPPAPQHPPACQSRCTCLRMVGAPAQSHQGNGAGHKAIQSIWDMVNDIKRETGDWLNGLLGDWGILGWIFLPRKDVSEKFEDAQQTLIPVQREKEKEKEKETEKETKPEEAKPPKQVGPGKDEAAAKAQTKETISEADTAQASTKPEFRPTDWTDIKKYALKGETLSMGPKGMAMPVTYDAQDANPR
ncbi:hypothetical protein DUI87_01712 [Hirundo rustica rustica]|uniref:Uncharacterized protein n=1 Tax=Hirundo rustica rustica TaxID=333673 RepID=A0A3M0L5U3_HIRRU|nr:hypothetical protein DUI87_01712 [Hirundo rustica rustica]